MTFDFSHVLTGLFCTAVGLGVSGVTYFIRSTSDTTAAKAMLAMTARLEEFGKDVMDRMDGLKDALHGVANANTAAAERHASLAAAHDKLDGRVSRIEDEVYQRRSAAAK